MNNVTPVMPLSEQRAAQDRNAILKIVDNIETVIVGKRDVVEIVVLAMIAEGHVLIEDVPGTGKTSLISALAKTVNCGFKRIHVEQYAADQAARVRAYPPVGSPVRSTLGVITP